MTKARKPKESNLPLNPAALRAMMKRSLSRPGSQRRGDEQRAQELLYEAMDASTAEPCLQLLQQALELDPGNPDALLMMADSAGFEGEERIEMLRGIVATGAKRLGKKTFTELVPHF